jgi:cyclic pyranopterin phosphate synthase
VCNFRCTYCLPDGYKPGGREPFLAIDEIRRLVSAFAEIGTWKIRLTGGEPTLRKEFVDIARAVAAIPGIRKLAFTTNGYKLPERAQSYFDAGLRAINISIDSLDPRRFHEVTGHNRLAEVQEGLEASLEAGFETVKVNTVLIKSINDEDLERFFDFVKFRPVSLRFIELMRTRDNASYFSRHHFSASVVREKLLANGWQLQARGEGAGPAQEFRHAEYQGGIGLIAPYSKDFCKSCNRLRMSARGELHLCLFGEGGTSIRHLLQSADQRKELREKIMELMQFKRSSHFLHDGDSGTRAHLASIGG